TMLGKGVTTVEIKSGYGLDWETESKMLRVVRMLQEQHPMNVMATFLGAHTIPIEFRGQRERYIETVCQEMIPAVGEEGLADFCDVFCEKGVFTVDETRHILEQGRAAGLRLKLHGEQLHRTGATQLAVEMGAVSVDHLERANESDIEALANQSTTTAVLLPGATLFLGWNDWAPARLLLDAGA
ncbi:MAG: imidazolonepropionase, partial [Planctomycetaceae bacterium]|nr:imidazolonepropionase [Planctomycetaceae bacterium]